MLIRSSPGACPVCGASHTACTGAQGPVQMTQLPARDALVRAVQADAPLIPVLSAAAPAAELGDGRDGGPVSTKTYRGKKGSPRR